jgi:hypothetical protein
VRSLITDIIAAAMIPTIMRIPPATPSTNVSVKSWQRVCLTYRLGFQCIHKEPKFERLGMTER